MTQGVSIDYDGCLLSLLSRAADIDIMLYFLEIICDSRDRVHVSVRNGTRVCGTHLELYSSVLWAMSGRDKIGTSEINGNQGSRDWDVERR